MPARLSSTGSGFASLAEKFERLADQGEQMMAQRGARAAQGVLADQFADTKEPSGLRWKPKKRPNGKPTLEASGEMAASARAVPGPNAEILLSVEGPAHFHQNGTSKMIARKILPEEELPRLWSEPIDEACVKGIEEAYEGR